MSQTIIAQDDMEGLLFFLGSILVCSCFVPWLLPECDKLWFEERDGFDVTLFDAPYVFVRVYSGEVDFCC